MRQNEAGAHVFCLPLNPTEWGGRCRRELVQNHHKHVAHDAPAPASGREDGHATAPRALERGTGRGAALLRPSGRRSAHRADNHER